MLKLVCPSLGIKLAPSSGSCSCPCGLYLLTLENFGAAGELRHRGTKMWVFFHFLVSLLYPCILHCNAWDISCKPSKNSILSCWGWDQFFLSVKQEHPPVSDCSHPGLHFLYCPTSRYSDRYSLSVYYPQGSFHHQEYKTSDRQNPCISSLSSPTQLSSS